MPLPVDIETRFKYHKPNEVDIELIAAMRKSVAATANEIAQNVPEGREQALALTLLEGALMWANAGIAREPAFQAQED